MSNTLIQILRSYTTNTPPSLQDGEQAYSFSSQKLFIGDSNNDVITIGGQYYTDIIDAATSLATPDTLVLRDQYGDSDFNVVNANTINAGDIDVSGNISITGTTSFTGNVITDINVTTNVNSDYVNTTNDINIGRDLYVTNNVEVLETVSANNGTFTNDVTISRDLIVENDLQVYNNLSVLGDFNVQGNVTTFNTETVTVEDKNLQLGNTATPTDISADGGGVTLMGDTDKEFVWYLSTTSWTSSENIDISNGKAYKIDANTILEYNALNTPSSSFDLLNVTAETVNAFGEATAINIGASSGIITINNPTLVGSELTQNVFNTVTETVNAFGEATSINIGAASGIITINNPTLVGSELTQNVFNTIAETVNAFGAATSLVLSANTGTTNIRNDLDVDGNLNIDGGSLTVSQLLFELANTTATTINFGGDATELNIGSSSGNTYIHNSLTVDGNTFLSSLYVSGNVNFDNPLEVISGGTGISYANTNGIIFGNATGAFQVTAQGVEGNVLQVDENNIPFFGMLDGGTF